MKISIIVPTINNYTVEHLINQFSLGCKKYDWEVIFIGPYFTINANKNVKFIKDFGSPSRCLQIASLICEGEYLCWCPDDVMIERSAIDECIDFADREMSFSDAMCLRYSEGENFSGTQDSDCDYWLAHTHEPLRLPGVKPSWLIAPLFMMKTDFFYEKGGLDCRYEHINMNTHDLMFDIQSGGGKVFMSPSKVFSVKWTPLDGSYRPTVEAFHQNDKPLFFNSYKNVYTRRVSLNNWKKSPPVWHRGIIARSHS